jgi:DNA-binding response OmpR family regulator
VLEKILIINDDPDVISVIKTGLENVGYDIIFAYGGESGVKKAKEERPDLIILDIILPDISGFRVCEQLKNSIDTKYIPVVALTVKSRWRDTSYARSLGAEDYITKPFEMSVLQNRIRMLLDKIKATKFTAPIEKEVEYAKKKILIASNDKGLLKHLESRFEMHTLMCKDKYVVSCVKTGPDVVHFAHLEHPDIIMLDVQIGADVYQICDRLKSSPTSCSIPIVLIQRSKEDTRRFNLMNFRKPDLFISYPVNFQDLLEKIKNLMAKKE